jgi:predicted lysophospholipase L1 biosynthesis ABC-type transport system permease subunit
MTAASSSVVVSERVAQRFWRGQDPIGKRIKFGALTSQSPWLTIVGVVGEVKYRGLPENPTSDPDVYLPFVDRNSQFAFAIRATVPPSSLVAPIRAVIRNADPSIPVYQVSTLEDLVGGQASQSRFTMWLMGVFAAAALMLAVVGIYGVMSYLVTQRTREIGVRMALGATRREVLGLILRQAGSMTLLGIGIGVAGALLLTRSMTSMLFGISAANPLIYVSVSLLLALVSLLAIAVPSTRATHIDPLTALRDS